MTTYPIRTRRWTRAEYDRMIEVGVFQPGDPVELLGGELIVAEPQGTEHYVALGLVEQALRLAFGSGWVVRPQGPIALDDESEPEPDVAVAPGAWRDYAHGHPSRPVLVVEVAASSLTLDRDSKGSLYARAGLDDYWQSSYREENPSGIRMDIHHYKIHIASKFGIVHHFLFYTGLKKRSH